MAENFENNQILLRELLDDDDILLACAIASSDIPPFTSVFGTATTSSANAQGICNAFIREEHAKLTGFSRNLLQKDELDFFRHVRMTKETFQFVIDVVKDKFVASYPGGNLPISCTEALLMSLWYFGNKSTYREIAEQFGVAESTVYVCVSKIMDIFCSESKRFIKWPSRDEMNNIEKEFRDIADFPGVLGVVDGCHVEIVAPGDYQADYLDRTHRHSVNLMAICDCNKKYIFVSAGFPGSSHDNRVFKTTSFYRSLNENPGDVFPSDSMHILGDSAFQIHRHVLVPYKDYGNLSQQQQNYNRKLSKTRCIVENSFAMLKGRFRRMKFIDAKGDRISKIIVSCCILHNITLEFPQELELLALEGIIDNYEEEVAFPSPDVELPVNLAGQEKRNFIASLL